MHAHRWIALGFTALALAFGSTVAAAETSAGSAHSVPPREWLEPATGHRVVRLSTEPGTRSLYFHQNGFTPDGRFVIASGPAGIYAIELATRANRLIVSGKSTPLFVGRKSGLVYFLRSDGANASEQQTPRTVFTVPITGGTPHQVAQIPRGMLG